MLTISTTIDHLPFVQETIRQVDRLEELVDFVHDAQHPDFGKEMTVLPEAIVLGLDWHDNAPPYIFPQVECTPENLLALVFLKLGNHQKALDMAEPDEALYQHLLMATHLQYGYELEPQMLTFVAKTNDHNHAIAHYYGTVPHSLDYDALKEVFQKAIATSKDGESKAFTIKHYVNLLLDAGELHEALMWVQAAETNISNNAQYALKAHRAAILMAQLQLPYDPKALDALQELQLDIIAFCEAQHLDVQAGLLLIEASEVANFKGDYIAAKELINRAIHYFRQEDIPEFLGEAGLKKAILLYTWSKNGHPQYYKAAINAFQDVLKVFKRDTHPKKFADIHHNLALIYSEIPVSPEEKPMWIAFCASSFKEVLAFYTKEEHPYEYAMACHNYATALMHFPPAKIHNNLDKAAGLFAEALAIRTATAHPFERALTLLNQLELGWLAHNADQGEELKNYTAMVNAAQEIKSLVKDQALLEQANEHLINLQRVKNFI